MRAYYGAPLSSIQEVLRTRSSTTIHKPMVALNGLNAAFWSSYALAVGDPYILVPNAIGAALSAVQMGLCALFPAAAAEGADGAEAEAEAEADEKVMAAAGA